MRHFAWALLLFAGCGSSAPAPGFTRLSTGAGGDGGGASGAGTSGTGGLGGASGGSAGAAGQANGGAAAGSGGVNGGASGSLDAGGNAGAAGASACPSVCPAGTTCGTANGLPVCRAPTGIPLFSHVFLVLMENTSLTTLNAAMKGTGAPNLASIQSTYATGAAYHGVSHPSLPNYVALTSGDTQGIGCDCRAAPNQGTCNALTCSKVLGNCSCAQTAQNLADQIETAQLSWMAFGESMGAPCNLTDSGNYAVRHVPFLYYEDIQTDVARCTSHIVDMSMIDLVHPATFTYIAPNLIDDMHNPAFPLSGPKNIANGDAFIGPAIAQITASPAYLDGGLVVIVWDEDDDSGGVLGSDDPIPIFVLSPYAKSGGYVSQAKADHYSLLATIEDGLYVPRLGNAGKSRPGFADSLADYFPAK